MKKGATRKQLLPHPPTRTPDLPPQTKPKAKTKRPELNQSIDLTSTLKSDIFLLQISAEKLLKRFSHPKIFPKQTIGDIEIQHLLSRCKTEDDVLSCYNYETPAEAVIKMGIKIELMQLVEKKMIELEKLVLKETQVHETNQNPTAAYKKSLSRIPSFLALLDRTITISEKLEALQVNEKTKELTSLPPLNHSSSTSNLENDQRLQELQAELQQAHSSLKTIEQTHAKEISRLQKQNAQVLQKCQQLQEQHHCNQQTIREKQDERTRLQRELETSTSKFEDSQKQVAKTKQQLREAQDQVQKFTVSVKHLQQQKQQLEEARQKQAQQFLDIQKELESSKATSKQQHTSLLEIQERNQALSSQVCELQNQVQGLQAQLGEVKSIAEHCNSIIADANNRQNGLNRIQELQGGTIEPTSSIVIDIAQSALNDLLYLKSKACAETQELSQINETLKVDNQRYEQELRNAKVETEQMKAALSHLERMGNERLSSIDAEKQKVEQTLEVKIQEHADSCEKVKQLNQEVNFLCEKVSALQEEKKTFLKQNVTDDSFADTYEEVMREEFLIMKETLSRRIENAEQQREAQERKHMERMNAIIHKHKNEQLIQDTKLRRISAEYEALKISSGISPCTSKGPKRCLS